MSDTDELLRRRQQVLGRNSPLFYERPLHLVRGEGAWVYDADGRAYLDVYNNVPCVGHCNPHVVEAISRQTATLNVHSRYLDENLISYAERLTSTFDESLNAVMLTCTGTESNELAFRIARLLSGGEGIIVSDNSYHGNSPTLAGIASSFPGGENFPSFARVVRVPDPVHDRQGRSDEELASAYAQLVQEAVDSLKASGIQVAALLMDPFFANEGLPDQVVGYVKQAVDIVRRAGGYFICDEVQSGFGRTGDAMWSHQLTGVTPDFVTLGKPMGNGFPVAGVVTRLEWVDRFGEKSRYFNTFAGNPVAAAAGMAVLEALEKQQLMENSRVVGAHVRQGLEKLVAKYPIAANARGRGLFFGLELSHPGGTPAFEETNRVVNLMRDNGVLLSRIGRHRNILKMRPPLVFSRDDADHLLSTLDNVLGSL